MSWADFYLICFVLGFTLSLLALLGNLHLHLPHLHIHLGGHAHAPHAGGTDVGDIAPINFGTVSAFLAWFGGVGYLLARYSTFWFLLGFGIACYRRERDPQARRHLLHAGGDDVLTGRRTRHEHLVIAIPVHRDIDEIDGRRRFGPRGMNHPDRGLAVVLGDRRGGD